MLRERTINGGTCQAECTATAITACTTGEGCCPSGCKYSTDQDCSIPCSSLTFDGVDDYVRVSDSPDFQFGKGDFTIEGWFKTGVQWSGSKQNVLVSKEANPNGHPTQTWRLWALDVGYDQVVLDIVTGPEASDPTAPYVGLNYRASFPAKSNQWIHVALQRTGSTFSFYVDGVAYPTTKVTFFGSGDPSTIDVSADMIIGSRECSLFHPTLIFTGGIAELRITKSLVYSSNFTPAAHLTALAQTVALYHFVESPGTTLNDYSSKAHDGAISSASWATDCP